MMTIPTRLSRFAGLAAVATLGVALVQTGPADAAAYVRTDARVHGHTLTVTGTNGDDDVALVFPADGTAIQVVFGGGESNQTFDRSEVTDVVVLLGNGDDTLRTVSGTGQVADTPVDVYAGNGDDTVTGGTGADVLDGQNGNDELRGGLGVDYLYGENGTDLLDGGTGADVEFLGNGADTARWLPGEGSDLVYGGNGHDTLDFDGANVPEVMSLSGTTDQALFLRDPGAIRMDLRDFEALDLSTLDGLDKVTLNGSARSENVDVRAASGAVDVTGLPLQTHLSSTNTTDQLQINTLAGHDRVTVRDGVAALFAVTSDLGTGQ